MPKEKVFGVFGLGTFGLEVCKVLSQKGGKVIAIDNNEKLIEKIKDDVTQAILIDSTDEEALKNAGIDDIDVAIVAIGENLEASILTTALLKNLNVPNIISRAASDIHVQILRQVGATEVINLEIEGGTRLANKLISPNVLDLIPLSKSQSLAEIYVPKKFIGKSLIQLNLRNKLDINIVSIKRTISEIDEMGNPQKKEIIIFPKAADPFKNGDILIVLGSETAINKLKEL